MATKKKKGRLVQWVAIGDLEVVEPTFVYKEVVQLFQTDYWRGTNYLFNKMDDSTNSKSPIVGG
jgi:hypothetical protein